MDLIFNELSCEPFCQSFQEVEIRVKQFLMTCKRANEKGFDKVRFHQSLHEILLTSTDSLQTWIQKSTSPQSRTLKSLLFSFYVHPHINDDDTQAIEDYINYSYFLDDTGKRVKTEGLAVAHIYRTLAISFYSSELWDKLEHTLIIIDGSENERKSLIYQVAKPEDFDNSILTAIQEVALINNLTNEADLLKLYPLYIFEPNAIKEILDWKEESKNTYERLHQLLKDIEIHPFTGGLGKTEALKNSDGLNSKRLTHGDRIVYSLKSEVITIFSCKGHYGDK
jgi:Txe/YoeB family toxin of toxin-antitoxin system